MKVDDFLARLEGVQPKGGGGWVAKCPAHPDDNPSLGIDVGGDGRILIKCYAGCSADEVVRAMGLKLSDLMPDNGAPATKLPRAKKAPPPAVTPGDIIKPAEEFARDQKRDYGKLVEAYDYQDASGSVIFRVERRVKKSGKKTFVQLHPDPSSRYGWSWGVSRAGVERVPFRLPRILAAGKAGKCVFVVEGEKDVLALERTIKAVATCNPGGAGKWQPGWGKHFAGVRMVCIIADKDPAEKRDEKTGEMRPFAVGQRHACDVEAKLRADGFEGVVRKIIMPDVDGRPVKDFADWVEAIEAAGGRADAAAFQAVLRGAGEWPAEWDFKGADVDATRAGKAARESASTPEGAAGGSERERRGRFGVRLPRAPNEKRDGWVVDFDIGGGKFVTLEIGGEWGIAEIFGRCYYAIARECPKREVPKDVPPRLRAWSAAIWLLMRGSFFWDASAERDFEKAMYLDRDPDNCRLMRIMSNEFFAFVGAAARLEDIEPKRGDMAKILGIVKQVSVDPDYSRGVTPGNSWQRDGDRIYVSNGDTMMCRISAAGCEMVQNGTDGVVFLRGNTLSPWTLGEGDGVDPFDASPVFRDASFVEPTGRMNVRLWVLNLFAQHRTKPMLLVTGKAQSGKTRLALAIKEMLGVRKGGVDAVDPIDVEPGDKGREAFWVAISSGVIEIFDNLDTKISWVGSTLQSAATGGVMKRRVLYKDDSEVTLRALAGIVLTSNNPLFSTDGDGGMADRLITINLKPRTFTDERGVVSDLRARRNEYLTWIVRTLSRALAEAEPDDRSVNKRHPDFGAFAVRCGRAMKREAEVVEAMGAAELEKSLLPLRNDIVAAQILKVLETRDPPWRMRFRSDEMTSAILAGLGDEPDDKTRQMYGSRRVGKVMSKYARQLADVFMMEAPRTVEGRTVYEVTGLTMAGRLALEVQCEGVSGGFGGFGTPLSQKPVSASVGAGIAETTPQNPPNPPHAHARIDNPSSGEEEKEKGSGEDLSDDWSFEL